LLGDNRAAATMSIGQWSEILAMLVIGWLMTRCRVKTMLTWALALALLRYGLFTVGGMTGGRWWMLAGVSLQGLCYTFYFVTAQIFLNRRVAPELRAQAQGLLVLVNGGIGTLVGTLVVGELHRVFILDGGGNWTDFWAILAAMVVVSLVVFSVFYRGKANDASGT
jgi:MFS family permease